MDSTNNDQHLSTSKGTFLAQLCDARTARVLFTSLIFLLVLAFLHAARETLTLFLFAILFAYFLAPLVGNRRAGRTIPKRLCVVLHPCDCESSRKWKAHTPRLSVSNRVHKGSDCGDQNRRYPCCPC